MSRRAAGLLFGAAPALLRAAPALLRAAPALLRAAPALFWAAPTLLLGCDPPAADSAAPAISASAAVPTIDGDSKPGPVAAPGADAVGLPPGQVRMAVIVLPGDALVEVDNRPVQRRSGAVDLVGKEQSSQLVRAFKGTTSQEWHVSIQAKREPVVLDLNKPPAPAADPNAPVLPF